MYKNVLRECTKSFSRRAMEFFWVFEYPAGHNGLKLHHQIFVAENIVLFPMSGVLESSFPRLDCR